MPEEIGTLGLDITPFTDSLSELSSEIPQLEEEIKQATAQLALMERTARGAADGVQASSAAIERQRRIIKELNSTLEDSKREYKAFNAVVDESPKKTATAFQSLSKLRSSIGLLFSGVALGGIIGGIKSLLDFGNQISTTSKEAGVLPEKLQRIQAALSDKLSADDAATALKTLNGALVQAKSGGDAAEDITDKFRQLGISFDDIKSKSPDQIFLQLADYVRDAKEPFEALRAVSLIFGQEFAQKLIPAIKQGGAAIEDAGNKATVASDKMIESAARGEKALTRFGNFLKQATLKAAGDWAELFSGGIDEETAERTRKAEELVKKSKEFIAANANAGKTGKPSAIIGVPTAPAAPASTSPASSPDGAKLELLKAQIETSKLLAPEYEKQANLLVSQNEYLEKKQKLLSEADLTGRAQLQLQMEQNNEALRALGFAQEMRDAEIELDERRASKGRGFYEEQGIQLAELEKLAKAYRIEERKGADMQDRQKMAAINAERRNKAFAYIEAKEQHDDEMASMRLQTREMDAQQQGMLGLVSTITNISTYQEAIVNALRNQNLEAADLLRKQQAIAAVTAKAAEHDITPAQRVAARRQAKETQRKARQQEAREAELQRRGNGEYATGSSRQAAPIDPFATDLKGRTDPTGKTGGADNRTKGVRISEEKAKADAVAAQKAREAQATKESANNYEAAVQAVIAIAAEVTNSKPSGGGGGK